MLFASRHENSLTNAAVLENFHDVADVNVRWALPFGLQRLETTVKVNGRIGGYQRMKSHPGQRIAVCERGLYKPLSGFIYEVEIINGGQVKYVCFGPGRRHYDLHDTTVYDETDTNDDVIKATLTAHVPVASADQSNIDAAGTAVNGWQPKAETGSLPGDIIQEMADMSDSSNNVYDYWLVDEPFNKTALNKFVPYFKARTTTGTVDWVVSANDLKSLNLVRAITDLRNDVTIYYGTVGGSATGGSATTLVDSAASFTTAGVLEGDSVFNQTDGSFARVVSVDSATTLTISTLGGGTANVFTAGDVYSITLQDLQPVSSTASTLTPWEKEYRESVRDFNVTQATQYATSQRERLDRPTQFSSFSITSPFIRDSNGAKWPLLEVIIQGGGYIRVDDLYPAAALFGETVNDLTTFFITALDYNYARNTLVVTVDNPSTRLDARLVKAGILGSQGAFI